jgi:acyl-CoA oxidase
MCLYALENLTSEEQKRQFLPLAQSYRIIATCAQTELSHGTGIRRLETEAAFNRTTDTLVLNSPTSTSTKFWPGSLGKTVNYVLLMAQLYTPDRDHSCGLRMFFEHYRIELEIHENIN